MIAVLTVAEGAGLFCAGLATGVFGTIGGYLILERWWTRRTP